MYKLAVLLYDAQPAIPLRPSPPSAKVFLYPVRPHVYQGGRVMVIDSDDAAAISVSAETRDLITATAR